MALTDSREAGRAVASDMASRNQKNTPPIPEELRTAFKPVHIYNVSPKRWEVSLGSLGTYTVQACETGQEYSRPTVVAGVIFDAYAVDMHQLAYHQFMGKTVALDIMGQGPGKNPSQDLARWGVFVSEGDTPTKQELDKAQASLEQRYKELVVEGDEYYQQGPNEYKNISSNHRTAAAALGQTDKPWMNTIKKAVECPGCGEQVNPKAAVHAGRDGCGAVLNEEQVKTLRLPGYEHIWAEPKQKKGVTV